MEDTSVSVPAESPSTSPAQETVGFSSNGTHLSSSVSEDDSCLDRSFESVANAYDFCVHFINKSDESVDSQFVNAEDNLSLDECMTILQDKLKRAMTNVVFKASLEEEPLTGDTFLADFVKGADTDLYVFYGTSLSTQRASSRW